jgi:hypothetical protein
MNEYGNGKTRRNFLQVCGVSAAVMGPVSATSYMSNKVNPSEELATVTDKTEHLIAWDVVRGQLYDYVSLDKPDEPDGPGVYTAFGKCGAAPMLETNVYDYRLNAPESFLVERVGLAFPWHCRLADRKDLFAFFDNYTVTIWIGRKHYFQAPLAFMKKCGRDGNQAFVDLTPLPLIITPGQRLMVQLRAWDKEWQLSPINLPSAPVPELPKGVGFWVVMDGFHNRGLC